MRANRCQARGQQAGSKDQGQASEGPRPQEGTTTKTVAAIIAALGVIFLAATALAKLWARWQRYRASRPKPTKSYTFDQADEYYLANQFRNEAPEDELTHIEIVAGSEPPRIEASEAPQQTAPPPLPARRAGHRRPERLGQFFMDLAKELGF